MLFQESNLYNTQHTALLKAITSNSVSRKQERNRLAISIFETLSRATETAWTASFLTCARTCANYPLL